jgi:hypothetical protein
MAFWVTRESRPFIALAIGNMALVACNSATPTAPSSLSARDAAPHAVVASVSSASVTTVDAQLTAANTIKITQGTLALQTLVPGTVELRGSHGFTFDGAIISGLELSAYCGPFDPCPPGTTLPFTATWVGTDIPGAVRLQGDEFRIGSADAGSMYIELTGSFIAPAHLTDTASVTVPFTASGLLSRVSQGDPLPTLQMIGSGEVTFRLEWQSEIGGWAIRFTSFDFGGGRATQR